MASVRGTDSTALLGSEVKSTSTDDVSFLNELKAEAESETRIPEFLQIILNMTPAFLKVFTKALNDHRNYTNKDRSAYLATIEPHSLFRWKQNVVKFRLAWLYQADDLSSFLALAEADYSLGYTLHCILFAADDYFEVDPDTKLTESKRNEWRKVIRQFEVRFEGKLKSIDDRIIEQLSKIKVTAPATNKK